MRLNYAKLTGFTSRPILNYNTRRRNGDSEKTYSHQHSVELVPPDQARRASAVEPVNE